MKRGHFDIYTVQSIGISFLAYLSIRPESHRIMINIIVIEYIFMDILQMELEEIWYS